MRIPPPRAYRFYTILKKTRLIPRLSLTQFTSKNDVKTCLSVNLSVKYAFSGTSYITCLQLVLNKKILRTLSLSPISLVLIKNDYIPVAFFFTFSLSIELLHGGHSPWNSLNILEMSLNILGGPGKSHIFSKMSLNVRDFTSDRHCKKIQSYFWAENTWPKTKEQKKVKTDVQLIVAGSWWPT